MAGAEITPTEAADRLAIRELFDAYAHCADRRDAEGQMSLFTEDAHFLVYMEGAGSAPTQELNGREALAPVFDDLNRYEATTHFNGQSTVVLDAGRATGAVRWLLVLTGYPDPGGLVFQRTRRPLSGRSRQGGDDLLQCRPRLGGNQRPRLGHRQLQLRSRPRLRPAGHRRLCAKPPTWSIALEPEHHVARSSTRATAASRDESRRLWSSSASAACPSPARP